MASDLNILSGVIKADDEMRMKRMIFRISRGRAIPQFFDLGIVSILFIVLLLYIILLFIFSIIQSF